METLVLAAGTALVSSMATDTWEQARSMAVGLWRRVHPERTRAIEDELEEVRAELLAARAAGQSDVEEGLAEDWQRRLRRLLRDDPNLRDELQRVLDEEWRPMLPADAQDRLTTITMNATASGRARVYQAGGNQTIHEG
ncbi:hypothetical protein QNO07_04000 [Streptomyces sp. 549]|uniref:hypothetical protein n=1 Tax=Streptomyces sp. 549 TaxID=3049076 RepID=UPI0024C2B43F|nr:hypothetical protein [Streptomyces sp. 549]MDK1472597.1 hypothetical protein [Streptomyces sp. 549]